VELNRVFVLVNENAAHNSSHVLPIYFDVQQQQPRWDGTAATGHPRKISPKQRLPPRWHDHVLAMAEVMRFEHDRVNGFPYVAGYSKDGPVVRALADAIPIITGEHASRPAIARKLEQVLK
jgi:hypothetical protein